MPFYSLIKKILKKLGTPPPQKKEASGIRTFAMNTRNVLVACWV